MAATKKVFATCVLPRRLHQGKKKQKGTEVKKELGRSPEPSWFPALVVIATGESFQGKQDFPGHYKPAGVQFGKTAVSSIERNPNKSSDFFDQVTPPNEINEGTAFLQPGVEGSEMPSRAAAPCGFTR